MKIYSNSQSDSVAVKKHNLRNHESTSHCLGQKNADFVQSKSVNVDTHNGQQVQEIFRCLRCKKKKITLTVLVAKFSVYDNRCLRYRI